MKIKGKSSHQNSNTKRLRFAALMLTLLFVMNAFLVSCGGNDGNSTTTTTSKDDQQATQSTTASTPTQTEGGKVAVPDVAGKSEADAVSELKALGFEVKVSYKDSEEVEKGLVMKTDRDGQTIDKGERIFVYVSSGKPYSVLDPKVDPLVEARGQKEQGANKDYLPLNYQTVKAMWLSQFDMTNIFCNTIVQRNKEEFTEKAKRVMENVKAAGCNTVFLQLRPNGDSFYPSEYYPWSKYVVGSYGLYADYDPLEIMIEQAHAIGISIHGWVNPMRGFDTGSMEVINISYPMKQWAEDPEKKDKYMPVVSDLYTLNPAYEEVRALIANGAAEIVRYYDIDGIHMDDYYYDYVPDDFDTDAFYESSYTSLTEFRRNNIKLLLSEMYTAIKAENPNVIFGISPVRNIWMAEYKSMLDLDTILSTEGYIDYICPQIYEGFSGSNGGFKKVYNSWSNLVKNSNIKLLAGLWFQDAIDENGEWKNSKDVLKRCVEFMEDQPKFSGFALFCYQNIYSTSGGGRTQDCTEEADNLIKAAKLIPDIRIEY